MKNGKKIIAGALAAALTLSMGSMFVACGDGGTDYTFEAEDAVLFDPSTVPVTSTMTIQPGTEWTGTDEEGAEVTSIGYFSTTGQTITWTITAASECDVTIKVRGSSCAFGFMDEAGVFCSMAALWTPGGQPDGFDMATAKCCIDELPAADSGVVLKVNDAEAEMSGTLPRTKLDLGMDGMMMMFGTLHFGDFTAKAHLKAGENKIVLECVTGGFNVDSITVKSSAELTFTKTDNSDRPAQNPQG